MYGAGASHPARRQCVVTGAGRALGFERGGGGGRGAGIGNRDPETGIRERGGPSGEVRAAEGPPRRRRRRRGSAGAAAAVAGARGGSAGEGAGRSSALPERPRHRLDGSGAEALPPAAGAERVGNPPVRALRIDPR